MTRVKNLWAEFAEFWAAAQGKPEEEMTRLWQVLYEGKHPEVFSLYFAPPHFGRWEHLHPALTRYTEEFEQIAEAAGRIQKLVPLLIEAVLTAFDALEDELELEVICFVGVYGTDGFCLPAPDRARAFFALECLADYTPDRVSALIAHEISHGAHAELNRRKNPKISDWDLVNLDRIFPWIAGALFREGLAVAASRRAVPGLAEHEYLFYSPDQWEWCCENAAELAARLLEKLDRRDWNTFAEFFAGGAPLEWPPYPRTGYYIGDRAIERLLSKATLRELAELEFREISQLIRGSLEEIQDGVDQT